MERTPPLYLKVNVYTYYSIFLFKETKFCQRKPGFLLKEFSNVILQSALSFNTRLSTDWQEKWYVCVRFCATATTVLTQGALERSLFHSAYTWLTLEVMLPCIHILQCTLAVTEITHGSGHGSRVGPVLFFLLLLLPWLANFFFPSFHLAHLFRSLGCQTFMGIQLESVCGFAPVQKKSKKNWNITRPQLVMPFIISDAKPKVILVHIKHRPWKHGEITMQS